jgi:hypothetical protein
MRASLLGPRTFELPDAHYIQSKPRRSTLDTLKRNELLKLSQRLEGLSVNLSAVQELQEAQVWSHQLAPSQEEVRPLATEISPPVPISLLMNTCHRLK